MSVMGRVIPEIENPVPVAEMFEMLTLELPVFVTVIVWLVFVLVVTLPNFREVGETESVTTDATLLPDSATTTGEAGELFVSDKFA